LAGAIPPGSRHPPLRETVTAVLDLAERERLRILDSRAFPGTGRGRGRREHLAHAIGHVCVDGLWLEFGVSTGASLNFIAGQTARIVHGFDWFEGLPEDWVIGSGYHVEAKGSYRGRPAFTRPNVALVDGLFEQSLPEFLRTHQGPVAFVHVDCDLYSSTRVVLEALRDRLVVGTVIAFDELYNYPNYADHEMKALLELAAGTGIEYTYLGHTAETTAASLQVTRA
jgi:Macrocin-O-methyltransferase (TylF)